MKWHWIALFFVLFAASSGLSSAAELEAVDDEDWPYYWVVRENSRYDAGINTGGEGTFILKRDDKRVGPYRHFSVTYLLEEKLRGKWVSRTLIEDGFETEVKPTNKAKSVEFIASYKGGGKVRFVQTFTSKGIEVAAEVLEMSSRAKDARAGVAIRMPVFTTLLPNETPDLPTLKKKLKDDHVKLKQSDGKRVKFNLYENISLEDEELVEQGVKEVAITSQHNLGYELTWTLKDDDAGAFYFRQRRELYKPFLVRWLAKKQTEGSELPLFRFLLK